MSIDPPRPPRTSTQRQKRGTEVCIMTPPCDALAHALDSQQILQRYAPRRRMVVDTTDTARLANNGSLNKHTIARLVPFHADRSQPGAASAASQQAANHQPTRKHADRTQSECVRALMLSVWLARRSRSRARFSVAVHRVGFIDDRNKRRAAARGRGRHARAMRGDPSPWCPRRVPGAV